MPTASRIPSAPATTAPTEGDTLATVWLVEDDENIQNLVAYTLRASGYGVRTFGDAASFYAALPAGQALPDALLLDIMLPGEDGLAVLKALRGREDTAALPVILLTARGEEYDKVLGLDAGADDYVAKPFGMLELVSRVKALLRRAAPRPAPAGAAAPPPLQSGPLRLDVQKHRASLGDEVLTLTKKEFDLLCHLLRHPGVVFTRDALLDTIWGYPYGGGTRTVDVHVRSLRQKLGPCAGMLQTVRGVGYRWEDTP